MTVFGSSIAQTSVFEIGGFLYDYDKNQLKFLPDNTFTITDVNGKDVQYTNCPNPSTHPDLSFNLSLLNFNKNQLPVVLELNEHNKYIGRTVKDLVLIQSHLLGKKEFRNLALYYSSDVNCNTSVSTADISMLRKYLLGLNKSDKCLDFYFTRTKNQIEHFGRFLVLKDTLINILPNYTIDYLIPTKLGDVNGSLFSSNPDAELVLDASLHDSVNMYIQDINIEQGKEYDIWITTEQLDILGIQIGFRYDETSIAIKEVNSTFYHFNEGHYNQAINELRIVIFEPTISTVNINGSWLNIKFTALKDGRLKDIFGDELSVLPHRVVMEDLTARPINFTFDPTINTKIIIYSAIDLKVSPNPSKEDISISINALSSINEGIFNLYNSLGASVYSVEISQMSKSNEIIIPKEVFKHPGLYIGHLETKKARQIVEIVRF